MTLSHPTITPSQLTAIRDASQSPGPSFGPINMGTARGSQPYRLVWVRMPTGESRLYRLIPDPPPANPV